MNADAAANIAGGLTAIAIGLIAAGFFVGQGLRDLGSGIGSTLESWDGAKITPQRDALVSLVRESRLLLEAVRVWIVEQHDTEGVE